ncbi:hypothetical protein [Streptomyces sp. NPDC094149]|uniref:hypothetical protein n=1 Tax=Streptomyces sp. NPDC094149 TaxID=3155079 RepID=UPI003332EEF9
MTGHLDEEPAEHQRFAGYLRVLEAAAEEDESDLVSAVLRDQDQVMADSAVGRHLDRRAAQLLTDPHFTRWAQAMAEGVGERGFLTRRLREWSLLRSIVLREPWVVRDLIEASDWLQRMVTTTQTVNTPDVLGLLAARGRTRRVRNAARDRLHQLEQLK